jgi:phosphatidylserine decarboxylase
MKKNLKKLVNKFKITLFHIIPLHFISNITYKVSRIEDTTIKNILINMYIYIFNIKLNEYKQKNIRNYKSLNDFFTRELDLSFRNKIDKSNNIIAPCDGTISGFGEINKNTFVHAKKHKYSIYELTHEKKNDFNNGRYINIYLEPKDCHRIYMPCDAYLIKVTHIPGSLYSVAPYASEGIKKLYSKNERVILSFSNEKFKMSLILIGAVNVGCISLTEQGIIAPSKHRNIITEFNNKRNIKKYKKGDEVGMFNLGSTVIILLSEQICQWSENIKIKKKILIRDEIIKKS